MNIVVYARYSSHSQNEQSIEAQIMECHAYAEKNGYSVVKTYIDRAFSATTDNRPEFLRMIEDSHKRQFEGVLVYQLDRFSRSRFDSAHYKAKLKKNGVRVISVRETISDDASGILVEGLLESMAEYYSVELSQKIRRGMDQNALKGLTTGKLPLGYKAIDKQIVIDEETAPLVKLVFQMYADGKSATEIIDYLNNNKQTSTRGVLKLSAIYNMLRNRRYLGIYTYKGNDTAHTVPQIIPNELFNEVAIKLEKNKKAPARTKAKAEYLLTTKLFCGRCREMMTGMSGTSRTGSIYYYYRCGNVKKKLCCKKSVKKDYIEDFIVEECRKQLTDESIEKIAKEVVKLCEKENESSELTILKKRLKENERKTNNTVSAVTECDLEAVRKPLYEQLAKLDEERKEIERLIAIEELPKIKITEQEVRFFLFYLKKGNINDEKYRKMLINVFINAIYLYDDKITIIFNSSDKSVTIEKSLIDQIEADNRTYESSFLMCNAAPY